MNPTTIVTAYEVLEMTPAEIAGDQSLEEFVVKMALSQHSAKYRAAVRDHKEEDVTDAEFRQILSAYKELALFSDNDFVRERAMRKLIDEKKGRFDKKDVQSLKVNIMVVNNLIKKTRALREEEAIEV